MTESKRKNKPGAGRPRSGKVKLTVHIMPETRAKLGAQPGAAIDAALADIDKPTA
jgi:hypothetical protein